MSSLLAVRSNNESRNRYENTVYITFGSFITQEMEGQVQGIVEYSILFNMVVVSWNF